MKTQFNKDDYIVLLKNEYNYNNEPPRPRLAGSEKFPLNFCYKQRVTFSYLTPYLDNKSSNTNAWSIHDFHKTHGYDWRYATIDEIMEYDRLNKPFDTIQFNNSQKEFKNDENYEYLIPILKNII